MKKNFAYQVVYQILLVFLPFITTPYISRVLGVDGVGEYSYAHSIVSYFAIFSALGMALYGNRKIAQVRDHKEERDRTFWEIFIFRILTSAVVLTVYVGFVLLKHKADMVFWVCTLDLIGVMLDISWFFFGIEEFKFTTIENLAVRIASLAAILMLVKKPTDVWIYTGIVCASNVLGQLILWFIAMRKINWINPQWSGIKVHIKPVFMLFIPVIAISLYKLMDKIMLGALATKTEVGYYYSAEKIVNIPTSVITALTTVMMPRMSNLVAHNDNKLVNKLMNYSIDFMSFSSVALCFGISSIMPLFVPIFFGNGYEKCVLLISLLSPVAMIISFEQVIRSQYLTPHGKDKEYTISTFWGAGVNLLCNLLLIPHFGATGAIIGTIAAELTVTIYQILQIRHELPISKYLMQYFVFSIIGMIMFATVRIIGKQFNFSSSYAVIVLQIIVGGFVYILISLPYLKKSENGLYVYAMQMLRKIKER